MIFFDVTKTDKARHQSGLMRVSTRLREELGQAAVPVRWEKGRWRRSDGAAVELSNADWLLTPELFSEPERPGFWEFLRGRRCRAAAIFHDAIPLKLPQFTWPQSVARHPEYLKMLASFDRVFAVSRASRDELSGFWKWQGAQSRAEISVLPLGADVRAGARVTVKAANETGRGGGNAEAARPLLLCVGIVEPRKNQGFLADVVEQLAREGLSFRCEFVGRVNPHFGGPIAARLKALAEEHRGVRFHEAASDETLTTLWAEADATLFATRAEGCGLPLLESLWFGVPCVYSDLPVLRENAEGGGCLAAALDDKEAWLAALRRMVTDAGIRSELKTQARNRALPTWRETAETLRRALA